MTKIQLSNFFRLRVAAFAAQAVIASIGLLAGLDHSQAGNWQTPVVTPLVNEKVRKSHAQELLEGQYKGSWAQRAEAYSGFMNLAIQNEIYRQLPEEFKSEAQKLAATIISESKHYGFDPVFVLAMIKTESRFIPKTVGRHGEIGLMQIKPETALWIARKTGMPWYGRQAMFNVSDNVRYGLAYLNYLRKSFANRPMRYLNAYNMGSKNVKRLIASESSPKIYSDKVLSQYRAFYVRMVMRNYSVMVADFTIPIR